MYIATYVRKVDDRKLRSSLVSKKSEKVFLFLIPYTHMKL